MGEALMLKVCSGPDPKEVQRAKELCEDLLANVREQYQRHKENPPQRAYGGGYGQGDRQGSYGGSGSPGYGGYSGYGQASTGATAPAGPPGATTSGADYNAQIAAYYGGQDPYAAYGGYTNYMAYVAYYQQQASTQQPTDAASPPPPPPPPPAGEAPPPPPSASPPGGFNSVGLLLCRLLYRETDGHRFLLLLDFELRMSFYSEVVVERIAPTRREDRSKSQQRQQDELREERDG